VRVPELLPVALPVPELEKEAEGEPDRVAVRDTVALLLPGPRLPVAERLSGALALLLAPA
jgi:hypothetical protein